MILTSVKPLLSYAIKRLEKGNISYGHGTLTAMEEAEFLIREYLAMRPLPRIRNLTTRLTDPIKRDIASLLSLRIRTRKPAAYLVNKAYIQGIPFYVDERVIVPRSFIGELLFSPHIVSPEASFIRHPRGLGHVLDLCTGSGCLAIIAAKLFPKARIDAVDLSADALEVAKINLRRHRLKRRISLFRGSLFAPVKGRRYDLIITNPPYVSAAAMRRLPPEYRHEPAMALAGGLDGLDLVRRILKSAAKHLNPGGAIMCEIGSGRKKLEKTFPHLPFFWLDTAESSGEVFWLTREDLLRRPPRKSPKKTRRR